MQHSDVFHLTQHCMNSWSMSRPIKIASYTVNPRFDSTPTSKDGTYPMLSIIYKSNCLLFQGFIFHPNMENNSPSPHLSHDLISVATDLHHLRKVAVHCLKASSFIRIRKPTPHPISSTRPYLRSNRSAPLRKVAVYQVTQFLNNLMLHWMISRFIVSVTLNVPPACVTLYCSKHSQTSASHR